MRAVSTKRNNAGRAGTALLGAARRLVLCLALLMTASSLLTGGPHAHAALGQGSGAHTVDAGTLVPCDDEHELEADRDGCCMMASACGICVPVPAFDLAFPDGEGIAAAFPESASLPSDTLLSFRPPKPSSTL